MNQHVKEITLKILYRNYPISRLKINKKFRRAILCDDGKAYPLDKDNKAIIKKQLLLSLQIILNLDTISLSPIIDDYIDY